MPGKSLIAIVCVSAFVFAPCAMAADAGETAPAATPMISESRPMATRIKIPEGTEIPLVFVDALSSATNADGDRFTLRVDGNVKIDGQVVVPAGAIAVGSVTSAHKRGHMGKAGELNIVLDHVVVGDDRVRIRGNKGKEGDAKVGATVALTVLFGPLGLLKRGHDVEIKPGTPIMAFVDQATEIELKR